MVAQGFSGGRSTHGRRSASAFQILRTLRVSEGQAQIFNLSVSLEKRFLSRRFLARAQNPSEGRVPRVPILIRDSQELVPPHAQLAGSL